jgi:hypothetical protein
MYNNSAKYAHKYIEISFKSFYTYGLFLILLQFNVIFLMYFAFVFYTHEDDHVVGRNM